MQELVLGYPDQLRDFTFVSSDPVTKLPGYKGKLMRALDVAERTWGLNKLTPRPYQVMAAAMYATRRFNICAGSPGIGKTLIVGFTLATLFTNLSKLRPGAVHIVVPSILSGRTRWLEDLEKIPQLKGMVAVLENRKHLNSAAPIWIYHQALLTVKGADRTLVQELAKHYAPLLLVVDEIHNFQPKTQRTKALAYLRAHTGRCLALSGTLTDARLSLLQQSCQLVYAAEWPYRTLRDLTGAFGAKEPVRGTLFDEDTYSEQQQRRYLDIIPIPKLPQYVKTLNRYVHRLSFDQTSVLCCCEFPSKKDEVFVFPATPLQQGLQKLILNQNLAWANQLLNYGYDAKPVVALLQPLLDISLVPPGGLSSAKYQALKQTILKETKVGVFATTVASARWLTQALEKDFPGQVVRLYARDSEVEPKRLNSDQREQVLQSLLYDPNVKVGVLALNLCAESIDLTTLSCVWFWGMSWSGLKMLQAQARAVRPGSIHKEVRVCWGYHTGLADEYQAQLVQQKMQLSRRLLEYDPCQEPLSANPTEALKLLLEKSYGNAKES